MSQLYKPITIQSLARNGILRYFSCSCFGSSVLCSYWFCLFLVHCIFSNIHNISNCGHSPNTNGFIQLYNCPHLMQKAIFEWRKPMIPHSEDAVQVTQHFANHFIRFVFVGCNLYHTVQVGNTSSGYFRVYPPPLSLFCGGVPEIDQTLHVFYLAVSHSVVLLPLKLPFSK